MTVNTSSQKKILYTGRYLDDRTREVSSQGTKHSTTIEENIATTPISLLGMARRIA